jgi:hypothetical protein
MKKIEILIVVDSIGALSSNNLVSNVYMVDSNQWLGSWQEGTCQLHTVAEDGQLITWSSCAISPDDEVDIIDFSGDMVNQNACKPQAIEESKWEGQIQTRGNSGRYSYIISLAVNGKRMNFSPYMEVQ